MNEKKLRIQDLAMKTVLALTLFLAVVETLTSQTSSSIAILADALHNFADFFLLLFNFLSVRQHRETGQRRHWHHLMVGTSAVVLIFFSLATSVESFERLAQPEKVNALVVLPVAVLGLAINSACLYLLKGLQEHKENVNLLAVFGHIGSDVLGSVAVIISSLIVHFTGRNEADPIAALIILLIVLGFSINLIRRALGKNQNQP